MLKQLLLIEDSKAQQMAWKKIFLQYGKFEVAVANDGLEGFTKLKETLDVIVTDFSMPKMNGLEFVNKFYTDEYESFHSIPIVILTVWSDLETAKEACKDHKNVMLISKEEEGMKLVDQINKFLNDLN